MSTPHLIVKHVDFLKEWRITLCNASIYNAIVKGKERDDFGLRPVSRGGLKLSADCIQITNTCPNIVPRIQRRDFKQIGAIIDQDVANFSEPKGTWWMVSGPRAFSALRQNLAVVCAYMEEAATGKGEEAAQSKGHLRNLRWLNVNRLSTPWLTCWIFLHI